MLGEGLLLDLGAEFLHLGDLVVAQFSLDRLHLLPEVVLTLIRIHLLLDPGTDLFFGVETIEVTGEKAEYQLESGGDVGLF